MLVAVCVCVFCVCFLLRVFVRLCLCVLFVCCFVGWWVVVGWLCCVGVLLSVWVCSFDEPHRAATLTIKFVRLTLRSPDFRRERCMTSFGLSVDMAAGSSVEMRGPERGH